MFTNGKNTSNNIVYNTSFASDSYVGDPSTLGQSQISKVSETSMLMLEYLEEKKIRDAKQEIFLKGQ